MQVLTYVYFAGGEVVLIQNSSGSQQNPGSSNTEQGRRGGNLSTVQKFKRSLQHSFSKLGKQKNTESS